ncbi:hypothetical protein DY000_02061916 [Brassica cretica]|uniref:WRKY domain-containing protein n=1 Tax=Brassica cretica TaxID=69181 RepID=A0ABQ7AV96_BRACR|nr:hypothetical protein DY000_02061916 [Brassica cretica]
MWAVKQIVIELNLLGQEGTPLDDGHCWRKYEQKDIHGYKNPRFHLGKSSPDIAARVKPQRFINVYIVFGFGLRGTILWALTF